jgi:hypothetical protein
LGIVALSARKSAEFPVEIGSGRATPFKQPVDRLEGPEELRSLGETEFISGAVG